jgi:hypothetical protein
LIVRVLKRAVMSSELVGTSKFNWSIFIDRGTGYQVILFWLVPLFIFILNFDYVEYY